MVIFAVSQKGEMMDLIERQAAIDAIEHGLADPAYQHTGEDWYVGMNTAESILYDLPSAQPEWKRGRWIVHYECPKCGEITKDFTKYCPFCNADMRGEKDG